MSVRQFTRQLVINGTTTLALDALQRAHDRRDIRERQSSFVRVLFFHGTPALHQDRFRRQLVWLREHFHVIDFSAFRQMLESDASIDSDRPAALMTFDDGFISNYEVAAPLLEEAGMRGVFFVVPAFSLATGQEARRFYDERVLAPAERFERAMTPAEIRDLAGRGHTIGNHTFSHARLSEMPAAEHRRELIESADLIESWTGQPVDAFAWPFVWDAITPAAHRLASSRHRYCFSPCAGRVDIRSDSAALLWRTNAETDRSFREFRFQCSGLADYATAGRRRAVERLLDSRQPGSAMRPETA